MVRGLTWVKPLTLPTATTTTMAASATGTTGMTRWGCRGSTTAPTIPTHARALKTPDTTTTRKLAHAGTTAMTAAAMVRARKLRATQPTARRGIARRHHPPVTATGWITRATPRAKGTAARNSQDTGTTARAKRSATLGARNKAAIAVAPTPRTSNRAIDGAAVAGGHASRTLNPVSAPRTTRTPPASAPNVGHELA